MEIKAVTYPERRLEFFREQLAAANRRLDWSIDHRSDCYDHAEKGEVVSFYEWAAEMAAKVLREQETACHQLTNAGRMMAEYIKRESLLEKCHWVIRSDGTRVYVCHAEDIEAAPAADVVPVIRGSWNLLRHDKFSDVFQCSECGRKVSLTHGRDVLEQFPYCHCGAKMEEAPCQEHQP